MSIFGDISKVAGSVLGNVALPGIGGALGGALGGEIGDKLGDIAGDVLKDVSKLPLAGLAGNATKLLDPWSDICGVLRGGNNAGDDLKFHGTDDKCQTGGTSGTGGGGSIFEKIFAILQKLQDQLNQKVKDLDGLDPNQDKAALDKGLFEVQQLQQQMTQLTSMATNLSSADHNSKKGIVDNLNIR